MTLAVAIIILGCQLCATWVFTVWYRCNAEDRRIMLARREQAMVERDMRDAFVEASRQFIKQQSRGGN